MNQRMSDGKSDVLLIIDLAPAQIFNDNDNSLAEAWMDNGNMLIWTGSEPFRSSVDAGGMVTDLAADGVNDGANKVLVPYSSNPVTKNKKIKRQFLEDFQWMLLTTHSGRWSTASPWWSPDIDSAGEVFG